MSTTGNSIAEALGRAHAALLEDLRQLEEATRPAAGEAIGALRARLDATSAHLLKHFGFEEHNGYMDAVRKREPRLEREARHLADEHPELAQSLEVLGGRAQALASLWDSLREEVRSWIERVRRHEARENDLVQDAFNWDIAAED
jgi:hypothetical protein